MQISFKTYLFAATASAALIAAGLVHGFWTDRWSPATETREAAELLPTLPLDIGDWRGKDLEVKAGPTAGVAGCLQRSYFNAHRGVTVVVALMCGRPGPVATHTPEVCYGANGYDVGEKKSVSIDGGDVPGKFWKSDAVRTRAAEETKVRLYWAWNGGAGWVASHDARIEFPRHQYPVLHKLYVLREISGPGDASTKDEPCEAFLHVLLPAMQQKLFAPGL
jgi:hypothetical protein